MATAALVPLLLAGTGCSMEFASMSPNLPTGRSLGGDSSQSESGQGLGPAIAARTAQAGGSASTEAAKPAEEQSDLAQGSVTHPARTSGMTVEFDYWTSKLAHTWRGEPGDVSLALHVRRAGDEKTAVKITQVRVTAGDDVLLSDSGEFMVTPPFGYQSGFTTPSTAEPVLELQTRVDLLVETEPGSGQFVRRAVLDTLRLTFAGE